MKLEALAWLFCPTSIAVSCIAVILVYLLIPSPRDRAVQHLPSPEPNYPILRNSLELYKVQKSGKFLDWVFKYCHKYQGKPWCIHAMGKEPCVVLCCPEAFEDVVKTQFDAFDKSPNVAEAMLDVLGHGIFAVSGPLWLRQRKIASHLFTAQMIQYAMEVVVPAKGEELVKRLDEICQKENEDERVVNIKRLLELYTMDIFAKVGFGVDLHGVQFNQNAEPLDAFQRMSVRILKRIQQPMWIWKFLRWLNAGPEKQFAEDIKIMDEFVYSVICRSIEEKKKPKGSIANCRKDLISLFIEKWEMEFTNGVHTTNDLKLMRDFAVSLLAAGRETTATTISWVILMLNRYPKVLEQVRHELKNKLPDLASGKMCTPSLEDIQPLVYLEATIRETLRLFPVVTVTGRSATRDVWLYDGTFIKAGTRVILPHYSMGRMTTVWGPDANEFKPERWLDSTMNRTKAASPFKFSVFLGGPRICLGMKFALLEMKITLAKLLSHFDLKTVNDPFELTYGSSITLQIKGPLDVMVSHLTK
ncbi:unnamed protein product [Peronospora belbahrii]|uniref:Cytochrome P450 n=1 Tax=Peronospora belbahrii TaxID=622444 RepID=A0AAU9KX10_9STRA|nr:unnamed protein product [Peronospora belbahrii]CAH0513952.1 unnamed protein product [Peronospora belbahrii]